MKFGTACCDSENAFHSGKTIAEQALSRGGISTPHLMLAFCRGTLDHHAFYAGLRSVAGDEVPIAGGSAIGIITNDHLSYGDSAAGCAVMEDDALTVRIGSASGLDLDEFSVGARLGQRLSSRPEDRLLFLFYDSVKIPPLDNRAPVLNGSSLLLDGMAKVLSPHLPIVGAGLVGEYGPGPTHQFCGFKVAQQTACGVVMGGPYKTHIRIMHGCSPLDGIYHTITHMEGSVLFELDGKPAVEMIDQLFGNRDWRERHPLDLLTIGVNYGGRFEEPCEAHYVNRLISGVSSDGKGICLFEPDLEPGLDIQFMVRDSARMIDSAKRNAWDLLRSIQSAGKRPLWGIYVDCAGRTAAYLKSNAEEAAEVQAAFNHYGVPLFGFYSGVEIAPLLRKSRRLDWTGVLLVLTGA
jgi:small ligand-binding sensory domain FIST